MSDTQLVLLVGGVTLFFGVTYLQIKKHRETHANMYGVVPIGPIAYTGLFITPGMPLNGFGRTNANG